MDREHVISVVLSDEDWKAFVEAQPQPVEWLRDRIRERISVPEASQSSPRRDAPTRH